MALNAIYIVGITQICICSPHLFSWTPHMYIQLPSPLNYLRGLSTLHNLPETEYLMGLPNLLSINSAHHCQWQGQSSSCSNQNLRVLIDSPSVSHPLSISKSSSCTFQTFTDSHEFSLTSLSPGSKPVSSLNSYFPIASHSLLLTRQPEWFL